MKGISSTSGLEIQIEPFIIDLTSPCSTAPTTPGSTIDECDVWADDSSGQVVNTKTPSSSSSSTELREFDIDLEADSENENVLASLFLPSYHGLSLFETLIQDSSPAARAAILYYLPLTPVVPRDISDLVPSLLHDADIMASLATNIAYYHTMSFTSEDELETLLMQILLCGDVERKTNQTLDDEITQLYHFTKQQITQHLNTTAANLQRSASVKHEQMLRKIVLQWEKKWRRRRRIARNTLPPEWHAETQAPLPYGCKTNADVFLDVNEMYTLAEPPSADWAQSRTSTYFSMGLVSFAPRVVLPDAAADARMPGTAGFGCVEAVWEERGCRGHVCRWDRLLDVRASWLDCQMKG